MPSAAAAAVVVVAAAATAVVAADAVAAAAAATAEQDQDEDDPDVGIPAEIIAKAHNEKPFSAQNIFCVPGVLCGRIGHLFRTAVFFRRP